MHGTRPDEIAILSNLPRRARTTLKFVRTRPEEFAIFPISTPTSVRTSLEFFGIDLDDFKTFPNSFADGRRMAELSYNFNNLNLQVTDGGAEFAIRPNSSGRNCNSSELVWSRGFSDVRV